MKLPSILTITERLGVPVVTARQIRAQFEAARDGDNMTDAVMDKCDKILNGHGVEALRGGDFRNYWGDTELLYVNMGDTYTATIHYDTRSKQFGVGSYGDVVESQPARFA